MGTVSLEPDSTVILWLGSPEAVSGHNPLPQPPKVSALTDLKGVLSCCLIG